MINYKAFGPNGKLCIIYTKERKTDIYLHSKILNEKGINKNVLINIDRTSNFVDDNCFYVTFYVMYPVSVLFSIRWYSNIWCNSRKTDAVNYEPKLSDTIYILGHFNVGVAVDIRIAFVILTRKKILFYGHVIQFDNKEYILFHNCHR